VAGGALLVAAALTVSVDVLARKLFAVSLGGADELSGYAFAIGSAWAFPFALLHRANVRVDALYERLPPKLCALLDILAIVALGVFAVFLARYAWDVMATSWSLSSDRTAPSSAAVDPAGAVGVGTGAVPRHAGVAARARAPGARRRRLGLDPRHARCAQRRRRG